MKVRAAVLTAFFLCTPAALLADQQADSLYKQSQATNDQMAAVELLCKAADLDPQAYSKKCNDARQFLDSRLQKFDGLYVSGKSKLEAKEYPDAITDLSKIYFGPHREEAQKLIAQAQTAQKDEAANQQVASASSQSLKAAQQAYDNGDFATAKMNAELVKAPELQAQVQAILSNIKKYDDDIQQAEAFKAAKNYAAAQQKYSAAINIKSNGPGNPSARLQEIAALVNQTPKPGAPPDNTAKIKASLADARDNAAKGDWQQALASYNQVLALDPKQPDALSGKQQAQDAMKAAIAKDPKALEDTLVEGIRNYYEAHFTEARDAISLYLTAGGTRSRGAAYFYLGATMLSQAIVANPKNREEHDRLQQSAEQQFQQAKQERFKPVAKYVSPKILAVWNQPGM